MSNPFATIEIRVRKGTPEGPSVPLDEVGWEDLPAIEFAVEGGYQSEEPHQLAVKAAAVPGVWEVRWNWTGGAGLGLGHYVPGTTQRERYPHLREG